MDKEISIPVLLDDNQFDIADSQSDDHSDLKPATECQTNKGIQSRLRNIVIDEKSLEDCINKASDMLMHARDIAGKKNIKINSVDVEMAISIDGKISFFGVGTSIRNITKIKFTLEGE